MPYGQVLVDTVKDSLNNVLAPASAVFRNRIINGAMVIDQRNAGASITPANNDFGVDRFKFQLSQSSKITSQQNAGGLTGTNLPVGFQNYLGVTSSSAYTVLSTDFFNLGQNIEGFNFADLQWGTVNAKTITLSFWVRSSLTGTFGVSFRNDNADRNYQASYTISSANTWTQISITVAGDTTGTWTGATNGTGLRLGFGLGIGSTYSTTAGSWQSGNLFGLTGATSVVGTSGATFYITGVQLEVGTNATNFDYRPYGTELALCQRYYYTSGTSGYGYFVYNSATASSNYIATTAYTPVTMRTTPTIIGYYGGTSGQLGYMTSNSSFTATSNAIYGSSGYSSNIVSFNLYGISALGIRGDYTASAEL